MSHMRLWAAATIIAFVILIGFMLSAPHTRDMPETTSSNIATTITPSVALRDSFKRGLHTISGSIEAPNPCTSLTAVAQLVGTASSSESILVEISMPEDSGVCLERVSTLSFSTTIIAAESLPITATVNGVVATTTAL